jgi:hypothetical protein
MATSKQTNNTENDDYNSTTQTPEYVWYRYDVDTYEYVGHLVTTCKLELTKGITDVPPLVDTNESGTTNKVMKFDPKKNEWKPSSVKEKISVIRDRAIDQINNMSDRFRSKYLTSNLTQNVIYEEKFNEAVSLKQKGIQSI